MIGKILYRPVREVRMPLVIETDMIPTIIGSSDRPDSVGLKPLTICMYSGRQMMPPNIPMPRMKFISDATLNTGERNIFSGRMASSPTRRSISTKAISSTAPRT